MAYNIYEMLGIENLDLVINSVGSDESKAKYAIELKKYLSKYSDQLSDVSKKRYKKSKGLSYIKKQPISNIVLIYLRI